MANKEKLLETAQKFLQKNQLAKAIKQYEKALELDDKDFRCRQKLAELYSRKGEVDKALTHYEKVAAYYADHAFYLKAIAVYKQMQRLAPKNDFFTLKLAKLNEQQGLVGNALAEYRTLLKYYESSSDLRSAIDILGHIRHLDPDNISAAVKQANYHAQTDQEKEAWRTFNEVEERLRQKSNYKHLEVFYQHFMKLWPDSVSVAVGYGRAMVDFDEPFNGVEYLTRLYHQHPDDGALLDQLAAGLHKCREFEREAGCLKKWVGLEPENLDIRVRFFNAALESEDFKTCFTALEESKERFFAAQRVAEIKPLYERLHEILPDNRDVFTSLRAIYEHLGEGEKLFDTFSGSDDVDFGTGAQKHSTDFADAEHGSPEIQEGMQRKSPDNFSAAEQDSGTGFDDINFDDITFDTVDEDQELEDFDSADFSGADPASSARKITVDVTSELEEVDFYLQQGLLDEAQEACQRLNEEVPGTPEVIQRLEKIENFRLRHVEDNVLGATKVDQNTDPDITVPADVAAVDPLQRPSEFQTRDEYPEKSLSAEGSFAGLNKSLEDDFDFDIDVPELADSQRGIETKIEDEDTESAYNLGIAYKEMGLYSDAVLQFNKAKADPARKVACISMQAECYMSMQQYEKAEEVLTAGLSAADLSIDERIALYYETGLLYEECGRHADALASYQVVEDKNLKFREVEKKVAELKHMLGVENSIDDLSRVSYV